METYFGLFSYLIFAYEELAENSSSLYETLTDWLFCAMWKASLYYYIKRSVYREIYPRQKQVIFYTAIPDSSKENKLFFRSDFVSSELNKRYSQLTWRKFFKMFLHTIRIPDWGYILYSSWIYHYHYHILELTLWPSELNEKYSSVWEVALINIFFHSRRSYSDKPVYKMDTFLGHFSYLFFSIWRICWKFKSWQIDLSLLYEMLFYTSIS